MCNVRQAALVEILMIATAPGKLILTGEYAVLDGAPALVIAIDRRVVATRGHLAPSSPFLLAVARALALRYGADSPAARAALEIAVDSATFYAGKHKLGLGSSAAVTVAATALALSVQHGGGELDRAEIFDLAFAAHANAQGAKGARGSGADVAAAVYGGALAYTMPAAAASPGSPAIARHSWPAGVQLIPFFTGTSADTATLVARIAAARAARPGPVDAALSAIADASRKACAALARPEGLIDALRAAARAADQLAEASETALVPPCVRAAAVQMQALGGTAKTTGAGGGDVAIAVVPASADVTVATRLLIEAACQPLRLTVDDQGVDTRPSVQ